VLTIHPHIVSRFRMGKHNPLLPLCVFMDCCRKKFTYSFTNWGISLLAYETCRSSLWGYRVRIGHLWLNSVLSWIVLLRRDACRNTSAPGSNTVPARLSVLLNTTCTYHARETLDAYSRTMQRLRPRYTNSIIYASINIRAAHSSLHSFNVRIHSTFIYPLARLLSSRFCMLNFISKSTLLVVQ
jgi:hypothetical protein